MPEDVKGKLKNEEMGHVSERCDMIMLIVCQNQASKGQKLLRVENNPSPRPLSFVFK